MARFVLKTSLETSLPGILLVSYDSMSYWFAYNLAQIIFMIHFMRLIPFALLDVILICVRHHYCEENHKKIYHNIALSILI